MSSRGKEGAAVAVASIYKAQSYPDSKVHGANIGLIWGRHYGPINLAITVVKHGYQMSAIYTAYGKHNTDHFHK